MTYETIMKKKSQYILSHFNTDYIFSIYILEMKVFQNMNILTSRGVK